MNREYQIIIKNETEQPKETPIAGSQPSNIPQRTSTPSNEDLILKAKGIAVYKTAENLANTAISYDINTINLRTGQSEKQERINYAYTTAKRVLDVGTATAIGLATGGGIGALVGLTIGTLSQVISISQVQTTINTNRNIENIGIRQANIRAGAGMSRNAVYGE